MENSLILAKITQHPGVNLKPVSNEKMRLLGDFGDGLTYQRTSDRRSLGVLTIGATAFSN